MVLGFKMGNGSFRDSLDLLARNAERGTSRPQAYRGPVSNELVFLKATVSKLMAKCC